MRTVRVAPSILGASLLRLPEQILSLPQAEVDYWHFDVMDGHFVPNLTFGPGLLSEIRSITSRPLDVHLMIESPERSVEQYLDAGADRITFHIEAVSDPVPLLRKIRKAGRECGLSLRPKTSVSTVLPFVDEVESILVMTVEPGFGGQSLIPECVEKLSALARSRPSDSLSLFVDGGITLRNYAEIIRAGADVLVAGSAIFSAPDPTIALRILKGGALV